jgi:pyruvate dehydrogenase E1 component beta subunit
MGKEKLNYGKAILSAFQYLMKNYDEVFIIGQGVTSPWYVGSSMSDLDKEFGIDRVIDTPVSELATTGVGIGASICGYRPVVIHPRMDFMILATDQIVNQAAKWCHMLGGKTHAPVTIRGIINRGGEQGAQHSQALHSWYAHIPGLRVVMPATAVDARDLLIASVLSNDPVIFIDDRWLYEVEDEMPEIIEKDLRNEHPQVLRQGSDITLSGCSFSTLLNLRASEILSKDGISAEVVDLRIINPLNIEPVVNSVIKTGNLCSVDSGWHTCGLAGEIIASVIERIQPDQLRNSPLRITLPSAPAPTSKVLEEIYYFEAQDIADNVKKMLN